MEREGDGDILGNLPRSRPGTRSGKRSSDGKAAKGRQQRGGPRSGGPRAASKPSAGTTRKPAGARPKAGDSTARPATAASGTASAAASGGRAASRAGASGPQDVARHGSDTRTPAPRPAAGSGGGLVTAPIRLAGRVASAGLRVATRFAGGVARGNPPRSVEDRPPGDRDSG